MEIDINQSDFKNNKYNINGNSKSKIRSTITFVAIIVLSVSFAFIIRVFVVQPFYVEGKSMEPSYSENDLLLIDEISYRFSSPERGDVVVFRSFDQSSPFYLKRIIGLPRETVRIQNGIVKIITNNGREIILQETYLGQIERFQDLAREWFLSDDEYFVMGDNRDLSSDSRSDLIGYVRKDQIIGKVLLRI